MKLFYQTTLVIIEIFFSAEKGLTQESFFKRDRDAMKTLTKDLESFEIKLVTSDTSASELRKDEPEIFSCFKFLKNKKLVTKKSDFSINILIDSIRLEYPDYKIESVRMPNYEGENYVVHYIYYLTISMQLVINGTTVYSIPLGSDKRYEKNTRAATIQANQATKEMTLNQMITMTQATSIPDMNAWIGRFVKAFKKNLWLFSNDFNEALNDYRRKGKELKQAVSKK
jgi:hypothetical protein